VIGTVIGSGIFLVPGGVLRQAGGHAGPALLVWVVGGGLSLLGALAYGELGAMNPAAGGLYVYLRDAFGPLTAFLYGWTFFLVIAVFATAVDPRGAFKSIAGLAIGLTITMDVFLGGPLTGASMNPARAFGPELIGNFWGSGWIYYVGPALGAVVAAVGYDWLYLRPLAPPVVGTPESGVAEPRPGDAAQS